MSEGLRLKCPNPECGHEWTYRGDRNVNATCPDCKGQVKQSQNKVETDD